MGVPLIVSERHGGVLLVQLNSPENRNALTPEMKQALWEQSRRLADEPELRCMLLTGCEKIFCAGGDLRSMGSDTSTVGVRKRMVSTHAFIKILAATEKPVVTAVNGAAVGAGMSLALMGDLVIARDDACFMAGFPRVGVLPDMGLLYHLPRAIGKPRASDLLMTNRRVDVAEALAMGLVSRVLPAAGFIPAALAVATQVAEGPAVPLGLTKMLMASAFKDSFEEFLLKESLAQSVVFGTDDFAEGQRAFAEKRSPRFTGR